MDPKRVGAVVLAAGASSRFGDVKLLAPLEGRPLLQHVLDTARAAGVGEVVVVLGDAADRIERAIRWGTERRVRNPDPSAGLSSSLRIGLAALGEGSDAALFLLGDQPLVRLDVIRALVGARPSGATLPPGGAMPSGGALPSGGARPSGAASATRPVVVPRYASGGGPNPALVDRSAWWLADEASGDRGLGPVLRVHPELVLEVPVPGQNPDVDTPADLAALAGTAREGQEG